MKSSAGMTQHVASELLTASQRKPRSLIPSLFQFYAVVFLTVPVHHPFPLVVFKTVFFICFILLQFFRPSLTVSLLPTSSRDLLSPSIFLSLVFLIFLPASAHPILILHKARLKCLPQTWPSWEHLIPLPFPSHQITSLSLKNRAVPR